MTASSGDGHRVVITSLPEQSSDKNIQDWLHQEFKKYGPLLGQVQVSSKGRSRQATVSFKSQEDMRKAIKVSHHMVFCGKTISIQEYQEASEKVDTNPSKSEKPSDQQNPKNVEILPKPSSSEAIILFTNISDAKNCLHEMNGTQFGSNKMKIAHADTTQKGKTEAVEKSLIYKDDICGDSSVKSICLDYNATTPLEDEVIDSINKALREAWGNPSSSHNAGVMAKSMIDKSREVVATMIGGKASDIVFTSGGTEANNMIIQSAVQHYMCSRSDTEPGNRLPHIISSTLEHDSIRIPLENLNNTGKADVTYIPACMSTGMVNVEGVIAAIRPNTCLVSIMLANNETGVIQPLQRITELINAMKRKPGETSRIFIHTDAAQALGKIPVDVLDLDVDYLTIVGHKFYGPRIGAIYARNLEEGATPLYPMFYGGGQERNFRPGTENTGMIAGLGQASEMVLLHLHDYMESMARVRDYLEKQLLADKKGKYKRKSSCFIDKLLTD
ncbi:hypothetical protein ScPMuIL_008680 [Solemya velum]